MIILLYPNSRSSFTLLEAIVEKIDDETVAIVISFCMPDDAIVAVSYQQRIGWYYKR